MDQLVYLALLIVCSVAVLKHFNKRSAKPEKQNTRQTSEETQGE